MYVSVMQEIIQQSIFLQNGFVHLYLISVQDDLTNQFKVFSSSIFTLAKLTGSERDCDKIFDLETPTQQGAQNVTNAAHT